ncbi:MAG: rubredoxin [Bacteroidia bacterium]|nr:rubredoxin [Bacteroidia bacterium]
MKKYKCKVCGYIYDENEGDPISGIIEGTLFKDLSKNWQCPVCSVGIEEFEETDD